MDFIVELVRWFWKGKTAKNDTVSMPVSEAALDTFKATAEEPRIKRDLDLEPRLTASDVLGDLQSLKSLTQQFDTARQDLIAELQRLAPPKKRNPFWDKKDAA